MVVVGGGVRIQACWGWFFFPIYLLFITHPMPGFNPMGPSLCLSRPASYRPTLGWGPGGAL